MDYFARFVLGGLAFSPAVQAWEVAEIQAITGVPDATALGISHWDGAPSVVWAGPSGIQVSPVSGESARLADQPMHDLVVRDLDGDGAGDLVGCGPEGLVLVRAADPRSHALSDRPCERLVSWDSASGWGALTVAGSGGIWVWAPVEGRIVEQAWEATYEGEPRLGGQGAAWALGATEAVDLTVESPQGRSTLATGSPVQSVAFGPRGWAWLAGEPLQLTDLAGPTQTPDGVTGVLGADLDGDGVNELLLLVPEAQRVYWTDATGAMREVPVPVRPDQLATGHLDDDGCLDWLVADGTGQGAVVRGRCSEAQVAPPVAVISEVEPPSAQTQAPPPPSGTVSVPETVVVGSEWGALQVAVGQPVSVQIVDQWNRARQFSARGGPRGLVVSREGVLDYTPVQADVGLWRVQIRVREGAGGYWSGIDLHVIPAGVLPNPAPSETIDPTLTVPDDRPSIPAGAAEERPLSTRAVPSGLWRFRDCYGLAGGGVGLGFPGAIWEDIGAQVEPSVSPAFALLCNGGSDGPVRWTVGADSAPWVSVRTAQIHTVAVALGMEAVLTDVRFGAFGTIGVVWAGAGGRVAWLPLDGKRGRRHGLEARVSWLAAPSPSFEGMVGYTWTLVAPSV